MGIPSVASMNSFTLPTVVFQTHADIARCSSLGPQAMKMRFGRSRLQNAQCQGRIGFTVGAGHEHRYRSYVFTGGVSSFGKYLVWQANLVAKIAGGISTAKIGRWEALGHGIRLQWCEIGMIRNMIS